MRRYLLNMALLATAILCVVGLIGIFVYYEGQHHDQDRASQIDDHGQVYTEGYKDGLGRAIEILAGTLLSPVDQEQDYIDPEPIAEASHIQRPLGTVFFDYGHPDLGKFQLYSDYLDADSQAWRESERLTREETGEDHLMHIDKVEAYTKKLIPIYTDPVLADYGTTREQWKEIEKYGGDREWYQASGFMSSFVLDQPLDEFYLNSGQWMYVGDIDEKLTVWLRASFPEASANFQSRRLQSSNLPGDFVPDQPLDEFLFQYTPWEWSGDADGRLILYPFDTHPSHEGIPNEYWGVKAAFFERKLVDWQIVLKDDPRPASTIFTKEQYDRIESGADYAAVAEYLAFKGQLTYSDGDFKWYQWINDDGSRIEVHFQGGKVISKSFNGKTAR